MKTWLIAVRFLMMMTLLTGVLYPLAVMGIARGLMKEKAEGSLIRQGAEVLGSEWISQKFEKPGYFWPRPSAVDYNPKPSSGSNLGPTSKDLAAKFRARSESLAETRSLAGNAEIPQDLLFASASGVDPHLSPAAAEFQLPRVARARGLDPAQRASLKSLLKSSVEPRQWGILGQPRINVLRLNLAIDKEFPIPGS